MKFSLNTKILGNVIVFISLIFLYQCGENIKENTKPDTTKQNITAEIFCFIESVDQQQNRILFSIDPIEFFTDDQANKEYLKDNPTAAEFPGTFYIRNSKIEKKVYRTEKNAAVEMQTLNYDEFGSFKPHDKIKIQTFVNLFSNPEFERYKNLPFKIVLKNKNIISITEIYIP